MPSLKLSSFVEIATGLDYPEGPVWLSDGTLLIVEVKGQKLTRLAPVPDEAKYKVLQSIPLGGGPNGAAIGPDGCVYVCNNGGLEFTSLPLSQANGAHWTLNVPAFQAADYAGGSIQKVDLDKETVQVVTANSNNNPTGLRGPDDIVFDTTGGFWFTDWGKERADARDITNVYYVAPGTSTPHAPPHLSRRKSPNGIGLSPAADRLYVAETYSRWVVCWDLNSPGLSGIQPNPRTIDGSHLLTSSFPGTGCLDSMALDEQGNLYVVTILPEGLNTMTNGGISVVSPLGAILEFIPIDIGVPEPLPSNLCFGGPDRRTAFITLGGTGRVVSCQMAIPGLQLAFNR